MPTTMLLRLAVVPLMLVIVAEPFIVLPARLKVSGTGLVLLDDGLAEIMICVALLTVWTFVPGGDDA